MRGSYKTKQHEQILRYLEEHAGLSISAKEIHDACRQSGAPVGLATIYRQLAHLIHDGRAKKLVTGDGAGIRFQYAHPTAVKDSFYIKCDYCGALTEMDCGLLHEITGHMAAKHGFQIDASKSVLYGRCESCKV